MVRFMLIKQFNLMKLWFIFLEMQYITLTKPSKSRKSINKIIINKRKNTLKF